MSPEIVEPAPAKLNLALHVRARRDDGYHDIETLFAFCAEGDVLTLEPAEATRLMITGPFAAGLACDEGNLVLQAYRAFAAGVAPLPPLALSLRKNLPVASGIGGGSADAAAALRAFARMVRVDPGGPPVIAVAAALGADVPACLLGRSAIGRGRGEALTVVDTPLDRPVLLVNPRVPVSTAAVFARWDGIDRGPLGEGEPWAAVLAGRNDLQLAAEAIAPVIGQVVERLEATAPLLARMSGSGATCFAIYADAGKRNAAAAAIAAARPDWWCLATELT